MWDRWDRWDRWITALWGEDINAMYRIITNYSDKNLSDWETCNILQPHAPLLRNFCLLTSPHHSSTRAHYLASAWPDNSVPWLDTPSFPVWFSKGKGALRLWNQADLWVIRLKRQRHTGLQDFRVWLIWHRNTLKDTLGTCSIEHSPWLKWTASSGFQQSFFLLRRCIDTRWYKHISCEPPFTSLSIFHLLDRWFQGITQTNFEHVFTNKTCIS